MTAILKGGKSSVLFALIFNFFAIVIVGVGGLFGVRGLFPVLRFLVREFGIFAPFLFLFSPRSLAMRAFAVRALAALSFPIVGALTVRAFFIGALTVGAFIVALLPDSRTAPYFRQ